MECFITDSKFCFNKENAKKYFNNVNMLLAEKFIDETE
jgi:hypothetical protein